VALLRLRILPDPVLRQKAKKVRRIDASIHRLADDMIETMHYEGGVGLAANQVGVLQRVAVIQLAEEEELRVLINPEVVETEGKREIEEGCLSIPGYRGLIFRSESIKVRAQDRNGKLTRIKADGLLAQALEHEIDHLNGILYIDHLESHEKLSKVEPHTDDSSPEQPDEPSETLSETSVEAAVD
jgi:peptide deformylase